MIIKIDYSKCRSCGKCVESCPIGIIKMNDVPSIDETRCIKCRTCVVVCPFKAIEIK